MIAFVQYSTHFVVCGKRRYHNIPSDPESNASPIAMATTATPGPTASTLYPKITGKLPDLVRNLSYHCGLQSHPINELVPFIGTVKLHGTHADIVIDAFDRVTYQSRNRISITPESDNLGFAAFCAGRNPQIKRFVENVRKKWQQMHAQAKADERPPVILAGEWIGQGVQKGVAIASLSRRFVICGIQVDGIWESMEKYAEVADEEDSVFNISSGGFFHLDFHLEDNGEEFMVEAKRLTLEVVASCPFGQAMGVEGPGEGVVWVPAAKSGIPNTEAFWLKTKGEQFATSKSMPKVHPDEAGLRGRQKAFAAAVCTESRLEQGWQYLLEMRLERSMKALPDFLRWMVGDIEVEEKREIEELKLGGAWKEIGRMAKQWFESKLKADVLNEVSEDVSEGASKEVSDEVGDEVSEAVNEEVSEAIVGVGVG